MWEVAHNLMCLNTWSPPVGGALGGFFFLSVTLMAEVGLWPRTLTVVSASKSWLAASSQKRHGKYVLPPPFPQCVKLQVPPQYYPPKSILPVSCYK